MAFRHVGALRVFAWGRPIGALAPSGRRGTYAFEYEPSWLRSGVSLAPVLMPMPSPTGPRSSRVFHFPGLSRESFHGLPPMIADAAPDRFGNQLITARLAREGVSAADVTALDRLAYVGERAMGALSFEPDTGPTEQPTTVELRTLVETARTAVRGDLDTSDTRTSALDQLVAVGTSAGGARAKAVLAWNRATGEMRAGNLPTPPGFEQWILKFDGLGEDHHLGSGQEYGRTEYAYSLMARAAGIEMSECLLLEEGGRAHFMTRRFDREASPGRTGAEVRLHMQTLGAVAGLDFNALETNDYASLFTTLGDLEIATAQMREQAFRRVVFNVLASNNDDHVKNVSFLRGESSPWRLSPAYDLTFAYRADSVWTRQHLMGVGGVFDDITVDDLAHLADRFAVPGIREVIADVDRVVRAWPDFAREAGLGTERTREIGERLALVRESAGLS
ncbi:type II toxin-antitoxin system HipA family toxin [Microbacterium sediminicola]|uniref:Type II toxin-antitoxin system HipA family toxin n=1 Tax=Microbacterium sediminicola TaxID=415210 RepID=A0ABP4UKR5_9MICO